jgi:putative DNA methylase
MSWDFAEGNIFSRSTGNIIDSIGRVAQVVEILPAAVRGVAYQADAAAPMRVSAVCSTDPPYYDNVGYADLSDFFYVWLRRMLGTVYRSECSTLLVPKKQELVADPYRHEGSREFAEQSFESGIGAVFHSMRSAHLQDFPMSIIYAFRQIEDSGSVGQLGSTGWETMLEGLLRAGMSVHGTWPIRSERTGRVRDIRSNALASSIVLTCRLRTDKARLATRKEFLVALRYELPLALRHLQQGNIAPVDLAQAAIGPGMGVFSRYAKVMEADGSPMKVRTALGIINQVLDETLAEQEADFDAETRWALAWFDQHGMNPGPFGVAETLSKAKNTAVNGLVTAGIVASRAGKVRLLDRGELPVDWDPATDRRLAVWEVTQHLIRALDAGGEPKAAELLRQVGGGLGETARELAYRLYRLCERKKWPKEALAYNALVIAWPEIVRLAAEEPAAAAGQQTLV